MYAEEIPKCVNRYIENGVVTSLSQAADCLAKEANRLSKNSAYFSPFNKSWKEACEKGMKLGTQPPENYDYLGGKEDDITVVVS